MPETKSPFSLWLDRKFLMWQMTQGERLLLKDFAVYLDVSNQSLSHYMTGRNQPQSQETIAKLATKLGPEIYDLLGLACPDPQIQDLLALVHRLTPFQRADLLAYAHHLENAPEQHE